MCPEYSPPLPLLVVYVLKYTYIHTYTHTKKQDKYVHILCIHYCKNVFLVEAVEIYVIKKDIVTALLEAQNVHVCIMKSHSHHDQCRRLF